MRLTLASRSPSVGSDFVKLGSNAVRPFHRSRLTSIYARQFLAHDLLPPCTSCRVVRAALSNDVTPITKIAVWG
jgi:hypothetical protein